MSGIVLGIGLLLAVATLTIWEIGGVLTDSQAMVCFLFVICLFLCAIYLRQGEGRGRL